MYDTRKPYKKEILNLIKKTWETPYVSVVEGDIEKKFSFKECDHTDGIGTKGFYHWKKKSVDYAVIDALAMNLNDLALKRAIPYSITDTIVVPEDKDSIIIKIVKQLVNECKRRNIAITAGETEVDNTVNGLRLYLTMSGFIENPKANRFKPGDILVGFKSNGLHSNGFTLIRELYEDEFRDEFIKPTQIYLDKILDLNKRFDIHGMCHVTGGSYTKLLDFSDDETDLRINNKHRLKPQAIFYEMYKKLNNKGRKKFADEDMYKTFNCGIGFIISVSSTAAREIHSESELDTDIIGEVVRGDGKVRLESMFSKKEIIFG